MIWFFVGVSTSCHLVLGRVISVAVEILVGEEMNVQIRCIEIVTCDHYISNITFCDNKYHPRSGCLNSFILMSTKANSRTLIVLTFLLTQNHGNLFILNQQN